METRRLVAMANEIAAFFEPLPDRDRAINCVAQHLKNFWDPRMRKQLAAHAREGGGDELRPLARDAVLMLQAETQNKPAT